MKKIILFSCLFFVVAIFHMPLKAQYSWQWAIAGVGEYNEYITCITCDTDGNIYAAGVFQDTVDFFGETIISAGYNDVFIACFAPNGNLNWVEQGGGTDEDYPADIFTDDQYICITGGFYNQATFHDETLNSAGTRDMFLLKYDLDGNIQWAVSGGGVTEDEGNSVTADDNGNIYVAGDINYTATFGSHTVNYFGFTDIFLAKYDPDGVCQWATSAGGPVYDYVSSVEVKNSHVFIGGSYTDEAQFDTASITSVEFNDIFIAHYMSDGSFVEVVSAGGTNNENLLCMAVDNDMNVYAGGWFMLDMTIGNNTFNSSGSYDIFLAKYEPGSGFIWSNKYGGSALDEVMDMYCDVNDNLIVTGTFESSIIIGSTTLVSEGYDDGFLGKFDENGTFEWVHQIGGSGGVNARACAADPDGNCYSAGDFVDQLSIGDFVFDPVGNYDLFLAQLSEGVGIGEDKDDGSKIFRLFPNPSSGNASIKYLMNDQRTLIIDLFEISGRKIERLMNEEKIPGEYELEIDVSDLPAGIYFIRMQAGDEVAVQKLVVAR